MVNRPVLIGIMVGALLLAGCQVDTTPQDVEHFSTNRAANKDEAEYNGKYALYGDDSDATVGPLLMKRHLTKGEIYGFEISDDHVPYAIAGKDRLQLQPGRYRWQLTPDPGQVDWTKTNTMTVEIVLTVAVVALIAGGVIVALR